MKEEWSKHPFVPKGINKRGWCVMKQTNTSYLLPSSTDRNEMKRPQFNPTFHKTIRWKQNVEINPTIYYLSACWYSSLHFASLRIAAQQDRRFWSLQIKIAIKYIKSLPSCGIYVTLRNPELDFYQVTTLLSELDHYRGVDSVVWIGFEVKCHPIQNKNYMRFSLGDYFKKIRTNLI